MNAIKQSSKNIAASTGNVATAATELTLVTTGILKDATGAAAGGVKAVPSVLSALWYAPKNAMVGYIKEDKNVSLEEAQKRVGEMLPDSVADAIIAGSIATGSVTAAMFADWDDESITKSDKQG